MIHLFFNTINLQLYHLITHRISMFDQSTRLCDIKYKIVFLGHSAVGKSALIQRFIHNSFDYGKNETIGIDFLVKNVTYQGAVYRLQLWDTAGQEKFKSLVPNYIRDAHCAVFVYDITRTQSFQGIDSWYELFTQHHIGDAVSILVGNKSDLDRQRKVSRQQGQSKSNKFNINFCQTSASTGNCVQELFHSIIQNIEIKNKEIPNSTEPSSHHTASTFSSGMNKSKVVKINKERALQTPCCYI